MGAGLIASIGWRSMFMYFGIVFGIVVLVLGLLIKPPAEADTAGLQTASKAKSPPFANTITGDLPSAATIAGIISVCNGFGRILFGTLFDAKGCRFERIWALTMFVLFIGSQIYSIALSYIVEEKALGTSAQSGNAMAFFAIGGFLLGLVFGKLSGKAKGLTLFTGLVGIIISYLVIAFAAAMWMIYLGAFIFGISLSICMPCVIVGIAGAVDVYSSAIAQTLTKLTLKKN